MSQRESFIFETVLSDPVGEKVDQLASYEALGYTVVLIFIRIESPDESIKRVAMRASQGGHDVPDAKLRAAIAQDWRTPAKCNYATDGIFCFRSN